MRKCAICNKEKIINFDANICDGCRKNNIVFFNCLEKDCKNLVRKEGRRCRSCNSKLITNKRSEKEKINIAKKQAQTKKERGTLSIGERCALSGKTTFELMVAKYGEEEAKKKWDEKSKKHSKAMSGPKNYFYGRSLSGELNAMYGRTPFDIWTEKYGEKIAQQKEAHRIEKMKNTSASNDKRLIKSSNVEKNFASVLEELNIKYVKQFLLKDKKTGNTRFYDYFLTDFNMLIEIDGRYWHGFIDGKLINKNDAYKDKLAKENGYRIVRVWEDEIKFVWRISYLSLSPLENFMSSINSVLERVNNTDVEKKIKTSITESKKIAIFGNGGSNSIAEHIATDLNKRCNKQTLTLSNNSLMTCLSNDYGYENIFYEFLKVNKFVKGDCVVFVSSSGRSKNILRGIDYCFENEIKNILICGFKGIFKRYTKKIDIYVYLDNYNYGIIELSTEILLHSIVEDIVAEREKDGK